MFVISQDRDTMIQRDGPLYTEAVIHNGQLWGLNLLHRGLMLGTFDTYGEALAEILQIEQCEDDIYYVSGYCGCDPDAIFAEVEDDEMA